MSKLSPQVCAHEETGFQDRSSSRANTTHPECRSEVVSSVHVNNCLTTASIFNKDLQAGSEKILQDHPVSCNSVCPDMQVTKYIKLYIYFIGSLLTHVKHCLSILY